MILTYKNKSSIHTTTKLNRDLTTESSRIKTHSNNSSNTRLFSNLDESQKNSVIKNTHNIDDTINSDYQEFYDFNHNSSDSSTPKIDSFLNRLSNLRKLQKHSGLFKECMIETKSNKIEFDYSNDSYKLIGYYPCNNRNCVYCSKSFNYNKRKPLEAIINEYSNSSSKSILHITFNLPNYKNQSLEHLLEILNKSFSSMLTDSKFAYSQKKLISKKARSSESIKNYIKLDGIYTNTEFTYNLDTRWNVHKHSLFFCNRKLNDSEINFISSQLIQIFKKYAYKNYSKYYKSQSHMIASKHFKNHCIKVQNVTESYNQLSYYLNKTHDIGYELTPEHKQTKTERSFNLSDFYSMLIQNKYDVISKKQVLAIIHNVLDAFYNKELSQYRLESELFKEIKNKAIEEFKQNQSKYMKQFKVNYSSEIKFEYIKNDIKNEYILKHHTSHIRRVLSASSVNIPFNAISLNSYARSLNKGIKLNTKNQSINKLNKLAPNTVIASNRGHLFKNTS